MGLLSDTDLEILMKPKRTDAKDDVLVIAPYSASCLTPVGYDLRVGGTYASSRESGLHTLAENETLKIKPNSTVLVETLESVGMPKNRKYSGIICSLVSLVSEGLSHISTTIDADWKGNMLIAVHNNANTTRYLKYGDRLCTAIFFENVSPATRLADLPSSRPDILLRTFSEAAKRARRKRIYLRSATALIFGFAILILARVWGIEFAATAFLSAAAGVTYFLIEQR